MSLPSVDELASQEALATLYERYPRALVVEGCRRHIDDQRHQMLKTHRQGASRGKERKRKENRASGENKKSIPPAATSPSKAASHVARICEDLFRGTLRRVVNATGVVVHTNLGRSPLPQSALERLVEVASGYSTLEYSLAQGGRGSRHVHASDRLKRLLNVEDAMVVNNNAAALLVMMATLAAGKEVVVSRGELVEIGGSFRIPDVMRNSGAHLVEVGTTNRTRIEDYRRAVTEETGLFLKVHRSNFAIVGFTESASLRDLVKLGREVGVPTAIDLGSGLLKESYADFQIVGGAPFPERGVREALRTGVDVLTFSGDKLLGGPQAGIVAGKKEHIQQIRKHPLVRAVRPGKLTFSALDAVLNIYEWGEPHKEIPTVKSICEPMEVLDRRCRRLQRRLRKVVREAAHSTNKSDATPPLTLHRVDTVARVGGGASPLLEVPSMAVAIHIQDAPPKTTQKSPHPQLAWTVDKLASAMRNGKRSVVGRVEGEHLLLDVRTVRDEDIAWVAGSLREALTST